MLFPARVATANYPVNYQVICHKLDCFDSQLMGLSLKTNYQVICMLSWTRDAAGDCARIRAKLTKKGMMIGTDDARIAAHPKSLGFTAVVSNKEPEPSVEGFAVKNWWPVCK